MRLYELIRFTIRVNTTAVVVDRLEPILCAPRPGVRLMSCWISEVGQQNQVFVLRGFLDEATRQHERERILLEPDAFAIGDYLLGMQVDDYTLFPFLEPLPPGEHGPFYEIREYDLVPSGLAPTLELAQGRRAPHGRWLFTGLRGLLCHHRPAAALSAYLALCEPGRAAGRAYPRGG